MPCETFPLTFSAFVSSEFYWSMYLCNGFCCVFHFTSLVLHSVYHSSILSLCIAASYLCIAMFWCIVIGIISSYVLYFSSLAFLFLHFRTQYYHSYSCTLQSFQSLHEEHCICTFFTFFHQLDVYRCYLWKFYS